jgi:hypothetical protein
MGGACVAPSRLRSLQYFPVFVFSLGERKKENGEPLEQKQTRMRNKNATSKSC